MSILRSVLFLLFVSLPVTGATAIDEIPEDTVWYLHADLAQMRDTESGQQIYGWLDGEVFVEINDEIGIDLSKEVDTITAFSGADSGTIIVVEGQLSDKMQKKVVALATLEGDVSELTHGDSAYFHMIDDDYDDDGDDDNDHKHRSRTNNIMIDIEDGAYVSFAVKNKLLITGNEAQMKELLDNRGKVAGRESHGDAIFVLTADKSFVQAGLKTDEVSDDDGDWESNILRNTEQAALMISDLGGMIAVEAQLVSSDAKMASAIGGIANGLIAMQAFNADLDPKLQEIISNTKIEVNDNVLSVNTVVEPELVVSILED